MCTLQQEHTKVVEAPRGQPLREVSGKQETGKEGKEEVVTVTRQGVARAAAAPAAQKDLHTEKQPDFKNKDNARRHQTGGLQHLITVINTGCYSISKNKTQTKELSIIVIKGIN